TPTALIDLYSLSLHDALPISWVQQPRGCPWRTSFSSAMLRRELQRRSGPRTLNRSCMWNFRLSGSHLGVDDSGIVGALNCTGDAHGVFPLHRIASLVLRTWLNVTTCSEPHTL